MYNRFLDLQSNTNICIYDTINKNFIQKIREFYKIYYNDKDIDFDYSTVYGITYIYNSKYKDDIYGKSNDI